ncbi:MAG: hypothetical protein IPP97_11770 [Candidatus Obscuribacter sp.]|nr:hypothetical protein [Candidatus Obscuribacter sp.]
MIFAVPPSFYMTRSRGAAYLDEDEQSSFPEPLAWFLALFIPLFVVFSLVAYQEWRFGKPSLVVSERILMRIVSTSSGRHPYITFVALPSQHLHDSQTTRKKYQVGSYYEITREIWQDKQSRYYEFPGL